MIVFKGLALVFCLCCFVSIFCVSCSMCGCLFVCMLLLSAAFYCCHHTSLCPNNDNQQTQPKPRLVPADNPRVLRCNQRLILVLGLQHIELFKEHVSPALPVSSSLL